MDIKRNTKESNDFEIHLTLGKLLAIHRIFSQVANRADLSPVAQDIFLTVERTLKEEGEIV